MKRLIEGVAAAAVMALVAGLAGPARASVTVVGGGLAQACSRAAMEGASDHRSEELCTRSLDDEMLPPRDRAGTFVNRGIMKLRRREFDAAMADFDLGVKYKPDLGEIYVNRGAALIGAHKYAEGVTEVNKGLELGAEEPEKAYYNRAIAKEGLDDVKGAYFDYLKALELSPNWDAPKQQLTRFHVARRE